PPIPTPLCCPFEIFHGAPAGFCLRWAGMDMLNHLLTADPAAPRLTVYNESTGARMDFSAQTLENWVAKIANLLEEELELDTDSALLIDLPVTWQAAVVALGSLAAGVQFDFVNSSEPREADDSSPQIVADAVFTSPDKFELYSVGNVAAARDCSAPWVAVGAADRCRRGVAGCGGGLPASAIGVRPTLCSCGDDSFGPTPPLPEL